MAKILVFSFLKYTCISLTSQVLLAGCQVFFFFGDLPFSPRLTIDLAQNDGNNLDGP